MRVEEILLTRVSEIKTRSKGTFDNSTRPGSFQVGDIVLRWDKRREKPGKHGKLDNLWLGPYIIDEIVGTDSFYLNDLEGERLIFSVNGFLLKFFFAEKV